MRRILGLCTEEISHAGLVSLRSAHRGRNVRRHPDLTASNEGLVSLRSAHRGCNVRRHPALTASNAKWSSSLLKKLARAKGVVIHFPGVILREGEDARTVPGSGRPFLVHPAGGADSGGSSAARDTQARSRGLEGAEP